MEGKFETIKLVLSEFGCCVLLLFLFLQIQRHNYDSLMLISLIFCWFVVSFSDSGFCVFWLQILPISIKFLFCTRHFCLNLILANSSSIFLSSHFFCNNFHKCFIFIYLFVFFSYSLGSHSIKF